MKMWQWRKSSTIPNLGIRWAWMVKLMTLPLQSQGESPQNPLDWKLGGPQGWSGYCRLEKNLLVLPKLNSDLISNPVHAFQ
jgi:hypothetical protein